MIDIKSKLNSHMLKCLRYVPDQFFCKKTNAKALLFKKNRFDLILKYFFVEAIDKGIQISFFEDLFKEQVRCLTNNTFKEGDGSKDSYEDFYNEFKKLIISIKNNGFSEDISIIPINKNGECIDGSHRLAAAAYFDLEVTTVELEHQHKIDYLFFKNREMPEEYLDYAALAIVELNDNSYIINLHSIAEDNDAQVEALIEQYFDILYKKEVLMSNSGYHWLVRTCYKNEDWIGSITDRYNGAKGHSSRAGAKANPVRVYIIESDCIERVLELKNYIRAIYDIGNYSVHITDTHEEALDLAQIYFNSNTLNLINNTKLLETTYALNLINDISMYKLWLEKSNIAPSDIIVDGSTIMGLYGLRETNDIDYITTDSLQTSLCDPSVYDNHEAYLKYHSANKTEILYDPRNYSYFENVKFISLETLYSFKKNRYEIPKDLDDMELMIELLTCKTIKNKKIGLLKIKTRFDKLKNKLFAKIRSFVIQLCPKNSLRRRFVQKLNRMFYNRHNAISRLKSWVKLYFGDKKGWINYSGSKLCYSKGTSIVRRFARDGVYEAEEQLFIKKYLNGLNRECTMMDIGANIGMMSLNALYTVKGLNIYAFEPGPHQHDLFKQTINLNKLNEKVQLFNVALSDEIGTADFSVHDSADVSGDGFIDTGRAGPTSTITVETQTLDAWWESNGKPSVDLVKMDVEGAEFKVVRGGESFFSTVKPTVVFEVHTDNLKNYPYTIDDLLESWKMLGYSIKNMNMSALGKNQLDKMRGDEPYGIDLVAVSKT